MGILAHSAASPTMEQESRTLEEAAQKALARRLASGAVLTYELEGWIVEESSGGRIKRLAPAGEFRAETFPYPGFTPPAR